ncbi:FMN-binding glutamate synthase family protein [Rhizosphaericola mali]|uniref:FMN-binding glutamate synthase family protein n=1 Tax=Rhizosphaericola mali TaxID=2545455 RepID=A0A5P2G7F4_9BACT|nr:FMN-binding glutamate synthase family protein [Rhizosphaericola mali]QES90628.1 FMN-binding glutamate synthase family protein [Rhizosphaericola mali]
MRKQFIIFAILSPIILFLLFYYESRVWWTFFVIDIALIILGIYDMMQTKHSIMRTFPIFGRLRYFMEDLRPKIYQYFVESDTDGKPINRIDRSTIYQRAKMQTDSMPFGTQLDVYAEGYEWISHSLMPTDFHTLDSDPRVIVGNKDCTQPYSSSIMNVSAMSYGALSSNAVEALNGGAKIGNFAHNTGEGGISSYHLKQGGDLIWQIGTGYFGCRDQDGNFSDEKFQEKAAYAQVKMIELKLSQGAKPGHGGILPAAKNTEEIAQIRHVTPHTTVMSPPYHTAFNSPKGLILFIQKLRELSGGKPVGFKLCIGRKSEFIAICEAMRALDIYPDFITVDGAEGGTGAAPQEFSNYVGVPLLDALAFVVNMLHGFDIKKHIKVFASGKVLSGFHIARVISLGADGCNSARAMMMALGCIQALLCNTNKCPTGVATQDPNLTVGLDVGDKKQRVANYHQFTVKNFMELVGAGGMKHYNELTRHHIYRRVFMNEMRSFEDIYPSLNTGALIDGKNLYPDRYKQDMAEATPEHW